MEVKMRVRPTPVIKRYNMFGVELSDALPKCVDCEQDIKESLCIELGVEHTKFLHIECARWICNELTKHYIEDIVKEM